MNSDISDQLAARVARACSEQQPLQILGGGSKAFYGNRLEGEVLALTDHRGIIEYQPSELVLTARAGTPLTEIEQTLADNGQMLAFEPPLHNDATTFGGAIASGLSGPRRAFAGAARDFVLGTRIVNGKGEILKFGGQVMKNVAGYDASRLMVGAQGTLGVLLDISVKVLPRPEREISLALALDATAAMTSLQRWLSSDLPISASCSFGNTLMLRLSSTHNSVEAAARSIGGEQINNDLWQHLRHQRHDFFEQPGLWRVSLPPATPAVAADRPQLIEWGGALRWIVSDEPLFELAAKHGGHACRYPLHHATEAELFQPLLPSMLALQRRIKRAFDPEGILNRGRLYRDL